MNRDELDQRTKDELQDMARDRDLAVSGTKDELIDRLLDDHDQGSSNGSSDRTSRDRSSSPAPSPFRRALEQLRDEFESTTGLRIEAVTALAASEDREGWNAQVQVVEQRRIPPTADVLAVYGVELDGDGRMTSLERRERTTRGRLGS